MFAVVGPSGAGKDTLLAGALAARPDLTLVRRTITRPTEAGGEAFDGVTDAEFARRKAAGVFALDWQAHGLRYGIPAAQIDPARDVLFNGSRAALPDAQARFPGLVVIVVTAPVAVLASRLAARGRETESQIAARLERSAYEVPAGPLVRQVVNDGTVEQGVARLLAALQADPRQPSRA